MAKPYDIPIPTRGFASDVPAYVLPPDTAVEWTNLRLDVPHIQPRGRMVTESTHHEAVAGTSASTYMWNAIYASILPGSEAPNALLAYGELADSEVTSTIVSATGAYVSGGGGAALSSLFTTSNLPLAPAANLYGVAYYWSGSALYQWAGSSNTTDTGKTFTINAGATSGTFSAAPTSGLAGNFLIDTNARTVNGVTYTNIAYPIVAGGGSTFVLGVPYGLGIPGWSINAAGASCNVGSLFAVGSAGTATHFGNGVTVGGNSTAIASHQERIFVEARRGMLKWTEATRPQVWPATNYAFVGDNATAITALKSTGRELLIFTRNTTWVLFGDSESNYTLRKLSDTMGCESPHAIAEWEGNIIVADSSGVYMISPSLGVTDLTYDTDRGVKAYYRANQGALAAQHYGAGFLYVDVMNDHLLITNGDADVNHQTLVCYLPTRSWGKWGNTNASTPFGLRKLWRPPQPFGGNSTPWRVNLGNCKSFVVPNYRLLDDPSDASFADTYQDEYRRNGTDVATNIPVTATFAGLRLAGGDTFTVNHMFVEHDVSYLNNATVGSTTIGTGSKAGQVNGYVFQLYNKPGTTVKTLTLEPRYLESAPVPGFDPDPYYTTEFPSPGDFALRGNMYLVKMECTGLVRSYNFCRGRVYRIRIVVEPGKVGTTDNPVL